MQSPNKPTSASDLIKQSQFSGLYKKSRRILIAVFLIYAALVASNRGEFWPFSIYPMFSSADRPWVRAIVRNVEVMPSDSVHWTPVDVPDLPGDPFVLDDHNVLANDVAAFLNSPDPWNPMRLEDLRTLLGASPSNGRAFVLYRVEEERDVDEPLRVRCTPLLYLFPETEELNPNVLSKG